MIAELRHSQEGLAVYRELIDKRDEASQRMHIAEDITASVIDELATAQLRVQDAVMERQHHDTEKGWLRVEQSEYAAPGPRRLPLTLRTGGLSSTMKSTLAPFLIDSKAVFACITYLSTGHQV